MSAATMSTPGTARFLEALLRDQQDLSAASQFALWHNSMQGTVIEPQYRELIPLTAPGPGEQYAFEVDLDVCSGCKACVTACHRMNGLDEHETWRSVGLFQSVAVDLPVLQHVTTACHHCVEPACLAGCPTQAYEKDPVTGIVRHLDDQCFGCQYCILMCPYEVPTYNPSRGIVRKCDMCRQRLAEDELPACVQGCPNSAIAIRVISQAVLAERATSGVFLPTAPDPAITIPSTTYRTVASSDVAVVAGDHDQFQSAPAHWPLVFMLVLTQMSVGILAVAHGLTFWLGWLPEEPSRAILNSFAAGIGFVGANLALLHLGRPLQAYRAWLGWRTSWLSREVLAFGVYVPLVFSAAAAAVLRETFSSTFVAACELSATFTGIGALYCSAMIYVATRRPWWSAALTFRRFAFTAFVLGNATCTALGAAIAAGQSGPAWWDYRVPLLTMAIATLVALVRWQLDRRWLANASADAEMTVRGCARLIEGELKRVAQWSFLGGLASALILPGVVLLLIATEPTNARQWITTLCVLRAVIVLFSEIADRYLFFTASVSPRMPGALWR